MIAPPIDEQRQAMADSPEDSRPGRASDIALPADDGGHGDDVIGIGRVSHAEKKTEEQNRKRSVVMSIRRRANSD